MSAKNILLGRCAVQVYRDKDIGSPCENKPRIERNGKLYCTLHDPDRVHTRSDKHRKQEQVAHAEWQGKHNHMLLADILFKDIPYETMQSKEDEFRLAIQTIAGTFNQPE